jgi:peroxiredoxin
MPHHIPVARPRSGAFRQSVLLTMVLLWVPIALAVEPADFVSVDLTLPTATGTLHRLQPSAKYRLQVVCFLGCECPLANLYAARLNQLASDFADQDVHFIGINSNPQDTMEEVSEFAARHELRFPMLKDHDAVALSRFGASRTPEVFVIDERGTVVYRGRIDDQYRPGVIQPQPTRDDLREAISESLSDRLVSTPRTEAAGCLIAKPRAVDPTCEVTYCGEIVTILRRHCTECHREGEIGPFSLTRYEDIVGWGDMMLEVIDQKRMPPWHATSTHEPLLNERQLAASDRGLLGRWVQGGMPFGDASQLPPEPTYGSGWQFTRTPDLVLEVSKMPFRVAAEGVVDYQYFVVDPGFEEDTWVEAAEVLPGNRSVLHHAIAFIRPPDGTYLQGLGMLTAYVPGQRIPPVTKGMAKRVPKGSKIVFQMHYTPTGTEQFDASKLGLLMVDTREVTHEAITVLGINHDLEIPPGEANATVVSNAVRLPQDAKLLSISPHMHLRGKSISVAIHQGEQARTILEVPHYDFNWQHTYLLRNPIAFEEGQSLRFTATFDNSSENPFNPDPSQFVTWGDQTFEEMAVVFFELAKPIANSPRVVKKQMTVANEGPATSVDPRFQEMTDKLMKDLDRNGDGVIDYDEIDLAVRWRLFRQMDKNGDRKVDREEVLQYVWSNR